jgi:hypothetical protein
MENLKVWIQDHSWRGCIVVIAETESQARELMCDEYNYMEEEELECHEIKCGHIHSNLGDLKRAY